jgi:predicted MFS family arabinose efflux permease
MNAWLRVFLPFALGYVLSYFLRNVNAVIAPDLERDLGISPSSLGLLTSTYLLAFAAAQLPLGVALDRFGPRRVESGLLLVAAAGIWSTPEKSSGRDAEPLRSQLAALGGVLRSREFWRFAPLSTLMVGGFMAIQGLWAVPWLMNVNGLDRDGAALRLLLSVVGMLTGFLGMAFGLGRLSQRGLPPERVLQAGLGLGLPATLLIVLGIGPTAVLWFVLGFAFSSSNLAYALLQKRFPVALAGRVNTALNLMVFVGAFSIQWGFGALVDALRSGGLPLRGAFQASLALLLVLQVAGWGWYARPDLRRRRN